MQLQILKNHRNIIKSTHQHLLMYVYITLTYVYYANVTKITVICYLFNVNRKKRPWVDN